jgi:hypothetical protein
MAEVLKLTPAQAMEKVQQQAAEAARHEAALAAAQSPEQVTQALELFEQQARESLQRLQAQRAQERHGTPTQTDTAAGPASHQGTGVTGQRQLQAGPVVPSAAQTAARAAGAGQRVARVARLTAADLRSMASQPDATKASSKHRRSTQARCAWVPAMPWGRPASWPTACMWTAGT